MTDRVPSPLDAWSQSRDASDGKGEVEASTHLVATSCFLSCNHMKSEMKSKCCVYVRTASCFRGSQSYATLGSALPGLGKEDNTRPLTLIVPSSSPVARRCGVGCTTRLMGTLGEVLGP